MCNKGLCCSQLSTISHQVPRNSLVFRCCRWLGCESHNVIYSNVIGYGISPLYSAVIGKRGLSPALSPCRTHSSFASELLNFKRIPHAFRTETHSYSLLCRGLLLFPFFFFLFLLLSSPTKHLLPWVVTTSGHTTTTTVHGYIHTCIVFITHR